MPRPENSTWQIPTLSCLIVSCKGERTPCNRRDVEIWTQWWVAGQYCIRTRKNITIEILIDRGPITNTKAISRPTNYRENRKKSIRWNMSSLWNDKLYFGPSYIKIRIVCGLITIWLLTHLTCSIHLILKEWNLGGVCPPIIQGEEDFIGLTNSIGQSPSEVYNRSPLLKNAHVTESYCLLPWSEEPTAGFYSEQV